MNKNEIIYNMYSNFVDALSRQSILSWTHYLVLLQVFDSEARYWYEKEALKGAINIDSFLNEFFIFFIYGIIIM